MSWSDQVNKTVNKAKKTYHAINLIKKYFNPVELKGLLTSNYFSVLFYNSEIYMQDNNSQIITKKCLGGTKRNRPNACKYLLEALGLKCSMCLPLHALVKTLSMCTHLRSRINIPKS